ncbi:hypothetical protein CAter10_2171 [Collimonas arenae]|nr:hypothetical protein CAter10_2171 [Collimonas arenae]
MAWVRWRGVHRFAVDRDPANLCRGARCLAAGRLARLGIEIDPAAAAYPLLQLTLAQVAPILPYLLLVLVMLLRPRGLLGVRD